jgi:GT2 family glycosyltransferase/glycosyltransferase involved in cell wall biosynthesis
MTFTFIQAKVVALRRRSYTGWLRYFQGAAKRMRAERRTALERIEELSTAVQNLEDSVRKLEAELAGRAQDVAIARTALEHKSAELSAILNSSTWRLLQPLRSILRDLPRARKILRRTAQLTSWILTAQVHSHILAQLRAQRCSLQASPSPVLEPQPEPKGSPPFEIPALGSIETLTKPTPRNLFTDIARAELLDFLRSGERLQFTNHGSPDISVILVLWNQAHLTLRCLRALLAQVGPAIEVILVDNASSDETGELLGRLDGVKMVANARNEGFLLGCNRGAAVASGRALLMLNNDAFVRQGALAAALATLERAPEIGAVGARLVLPSGKLQEAGSIIWSDSSCFGYARDCAEDAGEAMFRHDVDYCSGAFLMTCRDLWHRLGGFDPVYAPAYYEDTDYCMRLREIGYRVVYEPAAVVDHFEFGSEIKPGEAMEMMRRNWNRFHARHAVTLRQRHLPSHQANVLAARERLATGQLRLLVLDNETPFGSLGVGYARMRQVLQVAVSAGWAVTFYPLNQLEVDWEAARRDLPWEVEIVSNWSVLRLGEFLEQRRGHYDVVMVSRPDNMARVRQELRKRPYLLDGTRLVYDAEALFSSRELARARSEGKMLPEPEIEARFSAEVELTEGSSAIACVNEAEAEFFRARKAAPVYVLGHPAEVRLGTPGFADRKGFLFVGRLLERDSPNWQDLAWFARECWPLIRVSIPDAVLTVAGNLHPDHAELEGAGICLLGAVDDLRPLYDTVRVFVAPVRFAAGIPIKIIEATASGLPTAGTRLMARQLSWTPGLEIAAEDRVGALATCATELHEDQSFWEAMRTAAIERLARDHSPAVFREQLRCVLLGKMDAADDKGRQSVNDQNIRLLSLVPDRVTAKIAQQLRAC